MSLNKIDAFQKMLFVVYERGDKINVNDWYDEALFLSGEVSEHTERSEGIKRIQTYLESTFSEDTYTDFNNISTLIFDKFVELFKK